MQWSAMKQLIFERVGRYLSSFMLFAAVVWPLQVAAQVKACGGSNNWPPMSYQLEAQPVQGISVDLLRSILPQIHFELRPWQRCLHEVATQSGFDIAMSVAKNSEREKLFLFSKPYHALTPSYLYLSERFTYPPLQSLADLAKYQVCALHGANTSYTGLMAHQIESGATNYLSLQRKLERGYCDLVVEMREVLFGFAQIELLPFQSSRFQILNLPETKSYPLHFAVSKSHLQAQALIEQLNQGIDEQQKQGRLSKLIWRYQQAQ